MTGSDEREEGVPADTTGTNPEPNKQQRKAAKRAAKALKKQARTERQVAKQAKKQAKAEAVASAKAARATAKAEAKAAKADATNREPTKAESQTGTSAKRGAKAAKKAAKSRRRASMPDGAVSTVVSAARALLEEAAGLMRHSDVDAVDGRSPDSPEPEGQPEAADETEPAAPMLAPEGVMAPAPEAEAEPDVAPEAGTDSPPEVDAESEPGLTPEAETESSPEPGPEPEAAADAEAEPEAEAEPDLAPEAEAEPDLAPEAEAEPDLAPEAEAEPEGGIDSSPEPEPEPEPEPGPDVAPQPEPQAEAEPGVAPEIAMDSSPEAEPEPDAEPGVAPEIAIDSSPDAEPEVALEADVDASPDAAPEPALAPEAEADRASRAEPDAALEPEADAADGASGAASEAEPSEAALDVELQVEIEDEPTAGRELGWEPRPTADEQPALLPRISPGEVSAPVGLLAETSESQPFATPIATHIGSPVAASIDVGATSVHLLVGAVDGHRVAPLLDESEFLGLGDRVAAEGYLGDALRASLIAALERYATRARELGATSITIVATDPIRRAADAPTVVRDVEDRIGVPLYVLDHAEEGLLTLIGATGGSPVNGELLLVDIGGGSSEFVAVGLDGVAHAVGLPLGAARLTRELVRSDPPSLGEIDALRREVARVMDDAPEASPAEIVAVGGTSSNLLRLLPATAVDRSLTRRRIAVALAMLTVERSREAATRHLIRPERARILPAGAIIVDAVLERYRADRLRVSEAGIREGAILASCRGAAAWRDRLVHLALGWPDTARSADSL